MSTLRVDNIKSRTGSTITVTENHTLAVTGIVSVSSGGSLEVAGSASVGGAATITGSVDVEGTLKANELTPRTGNTITIPAGQFVNVGGGITVTNAGSFTVSGPTEFQQGATVSGVVTFTSADLQTNLTVDPSINVASNIQLGSAGIVTSKGVHIDNSLETVATGTTYQNGSFNNVILECDLDSASIFTHDMDNGTVGVVSFKDFPAIKNSAVTYTVIFTQQSSTPAGTGNTTGDIGIGTHIFLQPAGVTGFSTSAKVGSGSTVTISSTPDDVDFVSFVVHYNGSGSGTASNYKVYANGNGQFRYGLVGE